MVYEFAEDDVIDESLAAFRERLRRIEQVVVHLRPWLSCPIRHGSSRSGISGGGSGSNVSAPAAERNTQMNGGLTAMFPMQTRQAMRGWTERLVRILAVVRHTLTRLETIGANTVEVRQLFRDSSAEIELDPELFEMALVAADNWPHHAASAVHRWTGGIAAGTIAASEDTLDALGSWLEGLKSPETEEVTVDQLVEELTDVLSLPEWGKRHELYSAWIASQLDLALPSRPSSSSPTALYASRSSQRSSRTSIRPAAIFHCGQGSVHQASANWAADARRVSNPTTNSSASRTAPPLRPLRSSSTRDPPQANTPSPCETTCAHCRMRPCSSSFLVAHGPLGHGILKAVPDPDRALLHPDVRPDRPRESAAFGAAIASSSPGQLRLRIHRRPPLHPRRGQPESSSDGPHGFGIWTCMCGLARRKPPTAHPSPRTRCYARTPSTAAPRSSIWFRAWTVP